MEKIIITGGKKVLINLGKILASMIIEEVGPKLGNDFIDKQRSLIKIPDLKDVHIDEALRILGDKYGLIPTPVIAKPSISFADERESQVMYSEPRFGSRVGSKTTVKVYYLTQEVIEKSKELLGDQIKEFGVPSVVGLNIAEAREDLENAGIKVTEKLENPNLKWVAKEDGQVTRMTYPNDKKIGLKLKTGERVLLYYVNEDVILESKTMKETKDREGQERIEKISQTAQNIKNDIYNGVLENTQKVAGKLGDKFAKKKEGEDKAEEE